MSEINNAAANPLTQAERADQLLTEANRNKRGRLKIFFGAAPGVGKTYCMLQQAHEKQKEALSVLIGWVDTHGRADTQALLKGLNVLDRKKIRTRTFVYEELDIDKILKLRPALVVVDELAHSNAPGSRHSKRWQDVEELLDAGIDVYTAVNVQHLESLNTAVENLTGVSIRETVPDRIFDQADEVLLVDLPPNDLLARLKAGKIYLKQTVASALHGFFKKSNLLALRELALRKMSMRVSQSKRAESQSSQSSWSSGILLYLDDFRQGADLVRECSGFAYALQQPWFVVWTDNGDADQDERRDINQVLALAEELGATTQSLESLSIKHALTNFALSRHLDTVIMLEKSADAGLRKFLTKHIPNLHLLTLNPSLSSESPEKSKAAGILEKIGNSLSEEFSTASGYWQCCLSVVITTLLLFVLKNYVQLDTLALFYLFPTLGMALVYGTGIATLTVLLSAAAFNLFFLEPRYTLAITDSNYVVLLTVMLCIGVGAGSLIAKLKRLSVVSSKRSVQMQALLSLSRELGKAMSVEEISEAIRQHFNTSGFDVEVQLWECLESIESVHLIDKPITGVDFSLVTWCIRHGQPTGCGTNTLASSPCLYLPLKTNIRTRGAIVFSSHDGKTLRDLTFKHLADAVADLTALAFERLHYAEVSRKTMVEIETQRFRHMLINELSHDLRTPLTVISTIAQKLEHDLNAQKSPLSEDAEELLQTSERMSHLTENLLEMARLQSGAIRLNREWIPVEELIGAALTEMPAKLLKDFDIRTEIQDNCPCVWVDETLINRVLVNLLDNALKYCPKGARITVRGLSDQNHITISVSDNGPGLPANVDTLFDPFKRGNTESKVTGIGLGLSICKTIAKVHDGSLIASNNKTGGATFSLVLPRLEMPELEPPNEDQDSALSSNPDKPTDG